MPRRLSPTIADRWSMPALPSGQVELPPHFSVIVPCGEIRENQVLNPSFEIDSANWASQNSASGARVSTYSIAGAYSLEVTVGSNQAGGFQYGGTTGLTVANGSTYAFSIYFLCLTGGISYTITIGGTVVKTFKSTGFWQRISLLWTAAASSTSLTFSVNGASPKARNRIFYLDAAKFELCSTGKLYDTTYFDGDTQGLQGIETFTVYYWSGVAHASTSFRTAMTRSGGQEINLRTLGFTLTAIQGLGQPVPENLSQPFTSPLTDGEQFLYGRLQARDFSLAGRIDAGNLLLLNKIIGAIGGSINMDSGPLRQPFVLKYQPMDDFGVVTGPEVSMVVTYQGGLEGSRNNYNAEDVVINLKEYIPGLMGHEEGKPYTTTSVAVNGDYSLMQTRDGEWLEFGNPNAQVRVIKEAPDGTVYVGGDFTQIDGVGIQYAARYNPFTDSWSNVVANTAFNNSVYDFAFDLANDLVYICGAFTNANGNANADGICRYDPATNTLASMGTGINGTATCMAWLPLGLLYVGGTFASAGGVANTLRVALWTIGSAAWSSIANPGPNAAVRCVIYSRTASVLYWGGEFTSVAGVANTQYIAQFDGAVWTALGPGGTDNFVYSLAIDPNNDDIIIGGAYTSISGVTAPGLARFNSATLTAFTGITSASVRVIEFDVDGNMYVGGGFVTTTYTAAYLLYKGATPYKLVVDEGARTSATGNAILASKSGMVFLGHTLGDPAFAPVIFDCTHNGSTITFPVILIRPTSTDPVVIWAIINLTTGVQIDFSGLYELGEAEAAVLDFRTSTFYTNFTAILPTLNSAPFPLVPGLNRIAIEAGSAAEASIYWRQEFASTSDIDGKR